MKSALSDINVHHESLNHQARREHCGSRKSTNVYVVCCCVCAGGEILEKWHQCGKRKRNDPEDLPQIRVHKASLSVSKSTRSFQTSTVSVAWIMNWSWIWNAQARFNLSSAVHLLCPVWKTSRILKLSPRGQRDTADTDLLNKLCNGKTITSPRKEPLS